MAKRFGDGLAPLRRPVFYPAVLCIDAQPAALDRGIGHQSQGRIDQRHDKCVVAGIEMDHALVGLTLQQRGCGLDPAREAFDIEGQRQHRVFAQRAHGFLQAFA